MNSKGKKSFVVVALITLAAFVGCAGGPSSTGSQAASPSSRPGSAPSRTSGPSSGKRYALVIGNAEYRNIEKLSNTVNDARDIAGALEGLGFEVDLKLNVTEIQFGAALDGYVQKLAADAGNEGFFWYAGHGIQIGDRNYLLPVDASVESERTLQRDAYSLDEILADLENARNKVNVVILDACRNNPLPSSSRSAGGTRGLAAVQDVPGDLFVMFSTAPGDVAEDGKGKRNSPFAEAFLKYIDSPEPVVLMASDVISETMARTNNAQRPFSRGSIISDKRYSLNPAGAAVYVASAFIPEGQSKPLNPAGVTLASTPEGQSKPLNPAGAAPAYTPGDQAQSFYKEGMTRYNAEEWDGAIVYFTKAVELDPKFTAAYYYRGGAYRNKGAHDHAIADLTKAIELDPKDAKAYVRRGTAYDSKGDYDRAFADYTKAIELDPKNSAAYSNRGFAYYGKGDYDRAIADWTETVRLDPDNEFAKVHLEAAKKKRGR